MTTSLSTRLEGLMNETDFSGVLHVSRRTETLFEQARGLADRAHGIANTVGTQFAIASGTKAFTALAVMSVIEDGRLTLATPIREVLGEELCPLVDPAVTVGQLLAHTSGMGDYLDEYAMADGEDYILQVPVHRLVQATDYLGLLRGHKTKFPAGTQFAYCNSGYVLLARIIEIASGSSYHDVVERRVFAPAGMTETAFLRSDELPGSAAIGYLPSKGWRTNVLHLPVRGLGDGGAYSTVGDLARFWTALTEGRILPKPVVAEMVRAHSNVPEEGMRYGLGFWLFPDRDILALRGGDAGISFCAAYEPISGALYTAISNTRSGVWPMLNALNTLIRELAPAG